MSSFQIPPKAGIPPHLSPLRPWGGQPPLSKGSRP